MHKNNTSFKFISSEIHSPSPLTQQENSLRKTEWKKDLDKILILMEYGAVRLGIKERKRKDIEKK